MESMGISMMSYPPKVIKKGVNYQIDHYKGLRVVLFPSCIELSKLHV